MLIKLDMEIYKVDYWLSKYLPANFKAHRTQTDLPFKRRLPFLKLEGAARRFTR